MFFSKKNFSRLLISSKFTLIFIFLSTFSVEASRFSPEVDSLIGVAEKMKNDTNKVKLLNEISWKLKIDSFELALDFSVQATELSKELNYLQGEALALKNRGGIYYLNSKYADAYNFYTQSLEVFTEIGDKSGSAKVIGNLGSIFHQQGEYDKAIDYFFQSLEIKKEINDKKGIAKIYSSMGLSYFAVSQTSFDKALESFEKALEIYQEIDNKAGIATTYNRIANVYSTFSPPKHDKALDYSLEVLKIGEEIGDKKILAEANQAIGRIYMEKSEPDTALTFYTNSLKLWEELGNKFGIAGVYSSLSKLYIRKQNLAKAENYSLKAIEISKSIKVPSVERNCYEDLIIIYKATGNTEKTLEYTEKFYKLQDSIQNEDMANAITKLSVQNEFKSKLKEQELEQEKLEIKHKADEKRSRIIIGVSFAGLIFMIIFAAYIFRSLRNKQRANRMLEEKNEEINQQNEEIIAQNEEITKQKNEIELQRDEILASINYAKKIQNAVLPQSELSAQILGENHFVLFKPRDIVSGDFFWLKKIYNFTVVVAADCTGHGVPGAFMSMLGTSFLNEIVTSRSLDSTAEILNKLRKNVKKALGQKGETNEQKDGMDIALYVLDNDKNTVQFSGAYNPLYIFRKNVSPKKIAEISTDKKIKVSENIKDDISIIELKADRQPIGIYIKEKDFTCTKFQLEKGDKLYTFSDGFIDQFGGPDGQKYKSRNFKKLLSEIYDKPMPEQKTILDDEFNRWIEFPKSDGRPHEQIDDIIIIGLEI